MSFVTNNCQYCGVDFDVLYKKRAQKFCKLRCAYDFRVKPTIQLECSVCKKIFETKDNKRIVCSVSCASVLGSRVRVSHGHGVVTLHCKQCNKKFVVSYKERDRKSCGNENCRRRQIKETMSQNNVNVGDCNGMKRPENREKARKSALKKWREKPELRHKLSNSISQKWADGAYDDASVGRCKWFEHVKPDGTVIKVQGTWELAFAKWLDNQGFSYVAHKGRLEYTDECGQNRNYYPDFWVDEWDSYVDVKNDYHLSLQPKKLEFVRKYNPDINVRLLLENDLKEMGVLC